MAPVIFSFPKLIFIDVNDFTLSSSNFGFAFDEVQYDFPAKLKPAARIASIYLVFFLNCLRRHFLHYIVRQKDYFRQREVAFSTPRRVPEAACGVACFASRPFSAPPT